MVDLVSWLEEQIADDERAARILAEDGWQKFKDEIGNSPLSAAFMVQFDPQRVLAECEAKRRIIEWHKAWPVLVTTPPSFDPAFSDGPLSMTLRVSQQMAWMTQEEYRARFGDEPPTAPILRLLALPYADRPGYDETWRP